MTFTSSFARQAVNEFQIRTEVLLDGSHWDSLEQMQVLSFKFLSTYSMLRFYLPLYNSCLFSGRLYEASLAFFWSGMSAFLYCLIFNVQLWTLWKSQTGWMSNFIFGLLCTNQCWCNCNLVEFQVLTTSHSFTATKKNRLVGASENNPMLR